MSGQSAGNIIGHWIALYLAGVFVTALVASLGWHAVRVLADLAVKDRPGPGSYPAPNPGGYDTRRPGGAR